MIEQLKEFQKNTGKSWYHIALGMELPYITVRHWVEGVHKPTKPYQSIIKNYIKDNS